MNARAGDGRNIDDRALRRFQFRHERAGDQSGRDKIDVEHLRPDIGIRIQHTEAALARPLRRNAGIVDERVQPTVRQALAHGRCQAVNLREIRKVRLDMALAGGRPGAFFGKGLAGYGENAPALRLEELDRRMPDPAARSRKQHVAAFFGHASVPS
ncbi:hypothetical protein D9M70_441780 [compost metagenome]